MHPLIRTRFALCMIFALFSEVGTASLPPADWANITSTGRELLLRGKVAHDELQSQGYTCVTKHVRRDVKIGAFDTAKIYYENVSANRSILLYSNTEFLSAGNAVAFKRSDTLSAFQEKGICILYRSES